MYTVFINDEHVPVSEYEAIIQLLDDNAVDYIERPRLVGSLFRFGSTGAGCNVMVETEAQYQQARELIDTYQDNLVEGARVRYRAQKPFNSGREVLGWIVALVVIGAVLALSISIGF